MNHFMNDFEIMAPVGSRESLAAAIQGGADSIYFGIEGLNMRSRSSNNFTTDDLRKIVSICKEHGIKSYLTVNTVIYGEDLALMREIIDAAKAAEVSAIIAADVATKAADVQIGFLDRFTGSVVVSGDVQSVETALKAVCTTLKNTLGFTVVDITRS